MRTKYLDFDYTGAEKEVEIDPRVRRNAIIVLALAGAILWFPIAHVLLGRPPGFLRDLGFLSGPAGTPLAWILALAVAFAYATYTVRNNPLVREHWRALSAAKLLGVTAAVGAAVVEEAFFRRVIMDAVLSAGGGSLVQVVVSGLVFGLAHGVYGIVTGRLAVGLGVMIATGTVGIALGAVYVIGERSLAPVIVSHFIITATIQPGIMYAAFSGQMGRPKKGGGA